MTDRALREWLAAHDLEGLLDTFLAEDVTLDILPELTEEDLRELGLSVGMRRRLRKAVTQPAGQQEAPAQSSSTGPGTVDDPDGAPQGAQRRHITVVFIDMVGSTRMSSRMDPEELGVHITAFQQRASAAVTALGGFVARFMGDGLLAYFGYPVAHEDDAERAVRAGLDIIDAMGELASGAGPVSVRVGIASGLVVVGDLISAGETRERAAVGETPNLAARLQAVAAPGQVVVAAATRRLVGDAFTFTPLPALELKGFDGPVTAYAVGTVRAERTRFDARGQTDLAPLLGRDMELSLLSERWELACEGEGQAVQLVGEAGIGKSRITHALMEAVRKQEHHCLVYQCSPLHLDSPLWPVLQQLRSAMSEGDEDEPEARRARLDTLMARGRAISDADAALVAEALTLPPPPDGAYPDLPSKQKRLRVLHALLARLLDLSGRRPVLVVIEDVHGIDPTTRELIGTVLDAIDDARVMLLMTSRPEGTVDVTGQTHVTTLTLNRLGRRVVQDIIRNIAGEQGLPEGLLSSIVNRTDGVPLFVEELTKAMLEVGSGPRDGEPGSVQGRAGAAIPETLHDSLMARLDRVPAVKGVAQIAACIGREFDLDLLHRVCDLPQEELEDSLGKLVNVGLVFERGSPPAARYSFKHALVRDAAYESMLNARCREVHTLIADALESQAEPASPALVALHAALAGDNRRALNSYLAAGREAAAASANAEAVSHYRQALDLLSMLPSDTERGERELTTLQSLGVPLIAVRGYASPEVEDVFQRARTLCDTLGIDDARRFMVLRGLWNCLYDRSDLARSQSLASDLVELARDHQDRSEQALAYRALGSTLFVQGELDRGLDAFQRVLETPEGWSTPATRAEHGEAPEVVARQYAGWVHTVAGRPDRGLAFVEGGLALARELELPIAIAFSLAILELTLWLRGDFERCAEVTLETRALCEEQGFPFWNAHSNVFAGWCLSEVEPGPEAIARTRAGLDAWTATGAMLHVPTWSCVLAQVAIDGGALGEADGVLQRAIGMAQRHGELFMVPELLRLTAEVETRRSAPGKALPLLERAAAISEQHGSHWLGLRVAMDRARHLQDAGALQPAVDILDSAMERVPEGHECRAFQQAADLSRRLRCAP